ncbi:glycosyltransferase family 2 protein [Escherichia coli]|nr:glycosyltransferase family 2 protein [Escherichia coli]
MDYLVSIIMPSYNSEFTIKESIKSVIEQTYSNWELLITDDCSTDRTCQIVKEFVEQDDRIKLFVSDKNKGAGAARNNSIKESSGRFLAFLDSDDLWAPDKLKEQINYMIMNGYALTYTAYSKIDAYGNIKKDIQPPSKVDFSSLLKSNVIGCLTAIYDTELVGKVYMPLIRKRQDMALWLIILQKIDYAHCLNKNLAFYREGHLSLSSNKIKIIKSQWEFYRYYLGFGYVKAMYYFLHYIQRALRKHA